MLKNRLIASIFSKNELVVQSFGFQKYLPIGNIETAIEFLVNWDVDEIFLIDIDASVDSRRPNFELVKLATRRCFIPLTVGGGINSSQDIDLLLKAGADKVSLNQVTFSNPELISNAAKIFGSQCITVSIDVKKIDQKYYVYDYLSQEVISESPLERARKMQDYGAGEILLNSVDRDGQRNGYDIDLLEAVAPNIEIPVIALGGVGKVSDLAKGIALGGCQAVAAGNIFYHTEHSTISAKSKLLEDGVNVRLTSEVKYKDFQLDLMERPY
ncbi:HisA/HisF-related TIM barrel protein [Gammaproteobacteria bacterium]|nr:HisA/HisF-related TIM barrel protein [Gammaproteobacteria bacterium]